MATTKTKFDLYEEITQRITDMLEAGVVPWRSPILGRGAAGHPRNLESGRPYRGINTFLLAFTAYAKGYGSSYWMTFNQARAAGGSVRKGERSTMVVFWKLYDTQDKATGEDTTVPVLRYYNVFNAEQCECVAAPDAPAWEPTEHTPIESAEQLVAGYADGPSVVHEGGRAFWRPATDTVHIPEPTRFASTVEYYSTLFHELAHSTGHSTRLDRKLDTDPKPFGSADYGKEELVAEMASAFLCGHAGIDPPVIENQAAYVQGWLTTIKGDKRLVIAAAGQAQKAADWVRGDRGQTPP